MTSLIRFWRASLAEVMPWSAAMRYRYERHLANRRPILPVEPLQHIDVEIAPDGHVVAVWRGCQWLPFAEHVIPEQRAAALRSRGEASGG